MPAPDAPVSHSSLWSKGVVAAQGRIGPAPEEHFFRSGTSTHVPER